MTNYLNISVKQFKRFLILLLCFIPLYSFSQNADSPDDGLNAEEIIAQNKDALISVWYHTENYYSIDVRDTTLLNGSGFIFRKEGFVGTNFHVVDGIDSLLVKTSDGLFYNADIIIVDEKNDMAILKIRNEENKIFQTVKFGDVNRMKVGQEVFAIGSPFGYEYTISQGIVAGIRQDEKVSFTDPVTYAQIEKRFEKVIQITAAISPGNSGGALFNNKGEVIGITTYTYIGYGNLNFALAINTFINFTNTIDLANLNNEDAMKKRDESVFLRNFKLANNFKSQLTYNWYYSKQKDTMKTIDSFIVKQDSINKVNFEKAENLYLKCISVQPDSFSVYQELMDLYVFTENFEKAEQHYKSIREKFASDSLLNLLSSSLAAAYSSSKDYQKALVFYNKMLKQDSTDIYIYYQIGNIYEKMNNYSMAVKQYNNVIRKDSGYTQALIQLGEIYYEKLKDNKKAKHYLNKANEKEIMNSGSNSSYIDIPYYLGMIAVSEGRKLDAILSYMELKNIYTYSAEDNEKKLKLYKAIKKLGE